MTFDGYYYMGHTKARGTCGDFANQLKENWQRTGQLLQTLSHLRCCLFFEQRRYHHFGSSPEGENADYISALLQAIREKVIREEFDQLP